MSAESNTTSSIVEQRLPARQWRVLKLHEDKPPRIWIEVGRVASDYYIAPPDADDIGRLGGEGTYLLLNDTRTGVYEQRIVGHTVYEVAPEPDAPFEEES